MTTSTAYNKIYRLRLARMGSCALALLSSLFILSLAELRNAQAADDSQVQIKRLLEATTPIPAANLSQLNTRMFLMEGGISALEATAGGEFLVLVHGGALQVRDVVTGNTVRRVEVRGLNDRFLSIFPNGRVAVSSETIAPGLRFWDLQGGALLRDLRPAAGPHRILPGGRLIAYADGTRLLLHDVQRDAQVASVPAQHGGLIHNIAVAPDGRQIATISSNPQKAGQGTLTLWRLQAASAGAYAFERAAAVALEDAANQPASMEFDSASASIWTASPRDLSRWRIGDQGAGSRVMVREKSLPAGELFTPTLRRMPGSDTLAVAGSHPQRGAHILFYDTRTDRAALHQVGIGQVPYLALSADGKLLYTGTSQELRRRDLPATAAWGAAATVFNTLSPAPRSTGAVGAGERGTLRKSLPPNPRVEVVGVYEGGGKVQMQVQAGASTQTARSVDVLVNSRGRLDPRPIVLVLASFHPVIWKLEMRPEANVAHIVYTSPYESIVEGAGKIPVTRISAGSAFSRTDPGEARQYAALEQNLIDQLGKAPDGFQGDYRGASFVIGETVAPQPQPPLLASSAVGSFGEDMLVHPRAVQSRSGASESPSGASPRAADRAPGAPGAQAISSANAQPQVSAPATEQQRKNVAERAAFAEALYARSPYTSEEAALPQLLNAEIDLVASRWLAIMMRKEWRAPSHAPRTWDEMIDQLRAVLAPIARESMKERAAALASSGLAGKEPYIREYQRVLLMPPNAGGKPVPDQQAARRPADQIADMPDILAFHGRSAASAKWRAFWPEMRAYSARLAALHYRAAADPGLGSPVDSWDQRALALIKPSGGKLLSAAEWRTMKDTRFGLTLSGIDQFLLPLGTPIGLAGPLEISTKPGERQPIGFRPRFLQGRWEQELTGKLSGSEMQEIDGALTPIYSERKGYWFSPMSLEWDAYVNVSQQLRNAPALKLAYRNFASRGEQAMMQVWLRWAGLGNRPG